MSEAPVGPVVGADGVARCPWAVTHPVNLAYHDTEWGVPVRGEHEVFERITLEGFQSGLSWLTILNKRPAFREAFCDFDPEAVARFTDADVDRLMGNAGIVRNRMKIEAARRNAAATLMLREEGGLGPFVWSFAPRSPVGPRSVAEVPTRTDESMALSTALRKRGFGFVGPTTMWALMEAIGMVDPHLVGCHRRGSAVSPAGPRGSADAPDHG